MSAAPSLAPTTPFGQAAEHLVVRLRPDLVVQPQFYEGMTHYVIKDPLALKYFRFKIEEYFLLEQFDGKQTLQEVKKAFERKYRPQTISIEDLTRFVAQLHEAGIIQIDSPDQAKVLIRRRKKNRWRKVWAFLANILFIKIPIIDPERLLTGMYPYFRWIFTRTFITLSTLSMLVAVSLVFSQWKTFYDKLPDFQSFFNWWTIASFWVCLAVVKVIHEFGHGLTAKHFGGEVHEMGILFLVLTPALYCDVTDSWLLPNKWKRIWISAAGIYVECFLASIATFVWWYSTPGLDEQPGDGDDVHLLGQHDHVQRQPAAPLRRLLRDGRLARDPQPADQEHPVLQLPVPGEGAGAGNPGPELPAAFAALPVRDLRDRQLCVSLVRHVRDPLVPVAGPQAVQARVGQLSAGTVLAGSLGGNAVLSNLQVCSHPWEVAQSEKGTCGRFRRGGDRDGHGDLADPDAAPSSGFDGAQAGQARGGLRRDRGRLVELNVRNGEWVTKDTVLAKLSNPEKHKELSSKPARSDVNFCKASWLRQSPEHENRAQAKQYKEFADNLEPAIAKIDEQIGKLTLVSHRDGQVVGVARAATVGQWIKPGKRPRRRSRSRSSARSAIRTNSKPT